MAQKTPEKVKQEAKDYFWGANDAYKDVVDIPEKWNNESAVILYKNQNYDYHKYAKNVTFTTSIRKRIKLLDAAAVENYSEFSYNKFFRSSKGKRSKKSYRVVAVKIIKPDGTVEFIDVDEEAIKQDDKYKVAIRNLEIGDVLDFYVYVVESFVSKEAVKFTPEEETLADDYPVVDYKLTLKTENDFFITFKNFNGAPELKQIPNNERNLREYELVAHDIPKFESERYIFPLVQMPTYKFQAVFARSGKFEDRTYAFLPEDEKVIKSTVSKQEVINLYDDWLDVGKWKYDRYKNLFFENKADQVVDLYYFMRHHYLTNNIMAFYAYDKQLVEVEKLMSKWTPTMINNDRHFINMFASNLEKMDIGYDIIVAKKRYDGDIKELLFTENVNLIIKTHTTPTLYFTNPELNSDAGQISPLLEGTEVYFLKFDNKRLKDIELQTLPVSTAEDNVTDYTIEASLTDDFKGLQLKTKRSAIGHRKSSWQSYYFIYPDYVYEDYEYFKSTPFIEFFSSKKRQQRLRDAFDAIEADHKDKQKKWFEAGAKEFYELEDELTNYEYKIDSTGRYGLKDPMVYSESFDINNKFVKKAGPNLIVEIGKLMGNQILIKEEDQERTLDVYQQYAKKLITEVRFTVPEGYVAKPVDNLNKSFENEAGSFTCEAKIEGNQVIMTVTEIHAHNFEKAEDWPKLVAILNAANEASNNKVLLSKK
ncbi:hypothetical protein Y10_01670 [Neptunitalea sp. Y10]|uniref:DUF3857 domain-containing protein n=2 Tax=Neptunitalea lumnitzerae TaxID=2965509 RepID=A0ABQ5MEJ0_9FLAO|nr:hypothetical protein Y10_01670 [Neptunitalea sp. Y10]